ncbi:tetratricopeptide repeat protein [Aureisphaera galaxeae]|uniref:tetratricopeptide repeat protein n=1 Tax=Aureisphaera galaxeae TaxID=1538023 RepID=UPI00234FEA18|nr:tetratricopeptide repeat protein [Aureisphaera galaxeae]MDC8003112.1 tetratricopeptide repeat protein [Aureisphaera galaxeae]
MKTTTLMAVMLLAVTTLQAQKQEIKKAEQAVNAGRLGEAFGYLEQAKQIFAAADSETRAHFYVVEAEMKLANRDMDLARMESISNSIERAQTYTLNGTLRGRIANIKAKLNNMSARAADGEFKKKNYADAATLYNLAYLSTKDTILLYNAAKSNLLNKNYEDAFRSYKRLVEIGFTDSNVRYVATNIKTKGKEAFKSSYYRNQAVEQGTHKNPEVVRSSSKVPELLRGLTTSAVQVKQESAAVLAIDRALAKHPNDKKLLNQAYHMYRQLGAMDKYNKINDKLIAESPKDPNLYYNLGVSSTQGGDPVKAKEYYKKTLELDPNHVNAKINLSLLILEKESAILDEMNNLGMTPADDKRYEELKMERFNLYNEALPYLESIVKLQPKNMDVIKTLLNIYSVIGQDSKYAVLKARLDE